MQLRVARLCQDCEEIHDAQHCPVCGSESFAYISRWIPAPERRLRPRTSALPDSTVETYRRLLEPERSESAATRWLKRGAFGLAALGVARWLWQANAGNATTTGRAAESAENAPDRESTDD